MPDKPSNDELDEFGEAVRLVGKGLSGWLDHHKVPPEVAGAATMKLAALIVIATTGVSNDELMEVWKSCVEETREQMDNDKSRRIVNMWFRQYRGKVM